VPDYRQEAGLRASHFPVRAERTGAGTAPEGGRSYHETR